MKFGYQAFGPYLRPVIPIRVKYGASSVRYDVLVDSGADVSIFDAQVGEMLGIDIQKGEQFRTTGVGGQTVPYYVHNVEIEVGGWPYKIKAGFMPLVAGRFNYGIVGQKGFFEHFVIKFDLKKEEIDIKRRE